MFDNESNSKLLLRGDNKKFEVNKNEAWNLKSDIEVKNDVVEDCINVVVTNKVLGVVRENSGGKRL